MPVFLIPILEAAGSALAPIIAGMGLRLMTERVVRRITVITLRHFEDSLKEKHPRYSEALEVVAQAFDVPAAYKVGS